MGYSPWGRKESDTTERLHSLTHCMRNRNPRPFTLLVKVRVLVAQSCLTLCDPMDYSPPGSSVHGILQARILE